MEIKGLHLINILSTTYFAMPSQFSWPSDDCLDQEKSRALIGGGESNAQSHWPSEAKPWHTYFSLWIIGQISTKVHRSLTFMCSLWAADRAINLEQVPSLLSNEHIDTRYGSQLRVEHDPRKRWKVAKSHFYGECWLICRILTRFLDV